MKRSIVSFGLGGVLSLGSVQCYSSSHRSDDAEQAPKAVVDCDERAPVTCTRLGFKYEFGDGVAADPSRAARLYSKACSLGESTGCVSLGVLYLVGRGVQKNLDQARGFLRRACDSGDQEGCFKLAATYGGLGLAQQSDSEARELYESCCKAGQSGCCFAAGEYYRLGRGGAAVDASKGLSFFEQGCSQSDVMSCLRAAWMHESRAAKDANPPRGAVLYARAKSIAERGCGRNDGFACWRLGVIFDEGAGIAADKKKASELYEKACKLGAFVACKGPIPVP